MVSKLTWVPSKLEDVKPGPNELEDHAIWPAENNHGKGRPHQDARWGYVVLQYLSAPQAGQVSGGDVRRCLWQGWGRQGDSRTLCDPRVGEDHAIHPFRISRSRLLGAARICGGKTCTARQFQFRG